MTGGAVALYEARTSKVHRGVGESAAILAQDLCEEITRRIVPHFEACSVTQSFGRIRRVAYRHRFSVFPISLGRHPPVELASRSASSLCCLLCGIRRLACFTRRCPSRVPSASQFTLPRIVREAKTSRLCAVVFRPAKPHNHYAVQTATSGRYPVPCRSLVGVSTPKPPSSRPCRSRANPRPSPRPA